MNTPQAIIIALLLLTATAVGQAPDDPTVLPQSAAVPEVESVRNNIAFRATLQGYGTNGTYYFLADDDGDEDEGHDDLGELPIPVPESAPSTNTLSILQRGNGNTAATEQSGSRNYALMQQVGNQNTSTLLQMGDRNVYMSWLNGNNNRLGIEQIGNENTYVLHFTGSNLDHHLVQSGNGLKAIQVGTGTVPFGISQTGNGAGLTIEHNRYAP